MKPCVGFCAFCHFPEDVLKKKPTKTKERSNPSPPLWHHRLYFPASRWQAPSDVSRFLCGCCCSWIQWRQFTRLLCDPSVTRLSSWKTQQSLQCTFNHSSPAAQAWLHWSKYVLQPVSCPGRALKHHQGWELVEHVVNNRPFNVSCFKDDTIPINAYVLIVL